MYMAPTSTMSASVKRKKEKEREGEKARKRESPKGAERRELWANEKSS